MGVRFSRAAVVERGKAGEAAQFAGTVASYLEENYGLPVVWGFQVGGTVGTIHWYVDYEDMAAMEAAFARTMADEEYGALVNSGAALFVGSSEDTVVLTM